MPGPSPTAKPRAKARPTPTPTTAITAVLLRLGLGRASGLAPRSMIIVFAPSQRLCLATLTVEGRGDSSARRRDNDDGEEDLSGPPILFGLARHRYTAAASIDSCAVHL